MKFHGASFQHQGVVGTTSWEKCHYNHNDNYGSSQAVVKSRNVEGNPRNGNCQTVLEKEVGQIEKNSLSENNWDNVDQEVVGHPKMMFWLQVVEDMGICKIQVHFLGDWHNNGDPSLARAGRFFYTPTLGQTRATATDSRKNSWLRVNNSLHNIGWQIRGSRIKDYTTRSTDIEICKALEFDDTFYTIRNKLVQRGWRWVGQLADNTGRRLQS